MASPAAGFDQPFEMLGACHDRVRRSLQLLQRLVAHVAEQGASAQAQDAARDVLRYFDVAAPAHHADEELHVIPRLMAAGDARSVQAAQQLLADHALIQQHWQALRPLLQQLAAGDVPARPALASAAAAFVEVHTTHLTLEDGFAFPQAEQRARQEGRHALQHMGEEMAARRGAPVPRRRDQLSST